MSATNSIIHGDCLEVMRAMPDNSVDLVFGSPPYEAARTYGIDFKLRGQDWVDWMVVRMREMARVSRGLVAMVVEGQTRQYRWTVTPAILMADLHRAGFHVRKPPIYYRIGIPGSGGPDWLRNDYEFVVTICKPGKLQWSDNTAMGHPPKWAPGGEMSYRLANGERRNEWGATGTNGEFKTRTKRSFAEKVAAGGKVHTKADANGMREQAYMPPKLANPGNVIKCKVGGGLMGSALAHENEAPFPEKLAEFFIRSFCPPDGIVLDPFSGSGTTAAAAVKAGRNYMAIDVRESQVELTKRRLAEVQPQLF